METVCIGIHRDCPNNNHFQNAISLRQELFVLGGLAGLLFGDVISISERRRLSYAISLGDCNIHVENNVGDNSIDVSSPKP